jgi:plastocyanin
MMQRTKSESWRYNKGDIAMNAPHSSMRSVASTLVLATALLLLVSCSLGTQGPVGGFVLAAVPKGPHTHTIVIREAKFQPAALTVKVGDTVNWRNDDIVPHTATSTEPKKFDSGILPVGSSWKYVVTKGGTYFYNCTLHPNMKAKFIVQ